MSTSMGGYQGFAGPSGLASAGNQTGRSLRGPMYQPPGLGKVPKGYQQITTQNFTPEQMALFQQLFGNVGPESFLGKLAAGDQGQFEALEAPAKRQFGEALGQIGSRFSGLGGAGSLGARKSSGFGLETSSAAERFAENLQSQRLGLQRQALMDLMGLSESLLGQQPYSTDFMKKPESFLKQLLTGLVGGAGKIGGSFF